MGDGETDQQQDGFEDRPDAGGAAPGVRTDAPAASGRRTGLWIAIAVVVVIGAGIGIFLLARPGTSDTGRGATLEVVTRPGAATHEYVIPAGTAARIAAGEAVDIVPARLEVRVGDTLRIRNEDSEQARVGIFTVGPHEKVTMRFSTPGELVGSCDVHSSGTFTIDVKA